MSEEDNSSDNSKEEDPAFEHIMDLEVKKLEKSEKERLERMNELSSKLQITKENKERAQILDLIGEFSTYAEITTILIDIALEDKYQLCRTKAVSLLADLISEEEVKRTILQTLSDSSQQVRLWSVWALRSIIHDVDVRDILIRKLKFGEVSNRVKLWIIRTLSDLINDEEVMYAFLSLLKSKPNTEMRKLLLYYILQKAENPEITFVLSTHIQNETNKEIRREIVKKLIQLDNEDVNYALERLMKTEKDEETLELLKIKF
ncbi:MAG: HEAT repeat domain-containing protein [Asgard group archaeon]|nr:HEAT repeat domain-containing protein [Asgard group archaeon]